MRVRPTVRRKASRLMCVTGALLVALFAALSSSNAAAAAALELRDVLARTIVTPPARVAFLEERHNPLFETPMILSGYLEYLEAGVLRKVILAPDEQSLLIQADHVVIERDGETRTLSLNKSGALKTMLGAIEAILAGEADKLEAVFDYELSGSADSWSMRLTPASRRIARQLTSLQVDGDGESATAIRFDLKGGEWHQMAIIRDATEQ